MENNYELFRMHSTNYNRVLLTFSDRWPSSVAITTTSNSSNRFDLIGRGTLMDVCWSIMSLISGGVSRNTKSPLVVRPLQERE